MEGDVEGEAETSLIQAQEVLAEQQMSGARDRQKLGQPLHDAQQDRLQQFQQVGSLRLSARYALKGLAFQHAGSLRVASLSAYSNVGLLPCGVLRNYYTWHRGSVKRRGATKRALSSWQAEALRAGAC